MSNLLQQNPIQQKLISMPALRDNEHISQVKRSTTHQIVIAYSLSFGIAELIFMHSVLLATIYLLAILINLLIHAGRTTSRHEARVAGTLTLIPLLRLLSSTLLLPQLPEIYWIALVGMPLFVAARFVARFLTVEAATFPLPAAPPTQPMPPEQTAIVPAPPQSRAEQRQKLCSEGSLQLLFAALGVPLALIAFRLNPTQLLSRADDWATTATGVGFVLLFAGFTESYILYGLIQRTLRDLFSPTGAVLYTTLLVTCLYVRPDAWEYSGLMVIVGLLFSLWTELTHSFWGAALAHGVMVVLLYYWLPM